ncbi:hypothetical protein EVAR_8327_1 [Eumeta japonica]|uniref:Uncharacterized protein n=1 Tax=Eumeta variegata TaxID=151549 RepID=A0A4C1VEX0_EUMVA|nr:hypothetical protein EVAR_8327_1 [Eumeta japonica]
MPIYGHTEQTAMCKILGIIRIKSLQRDTLENLTVKTISGHKNSVSRDLVKTSVADGVTVLVTTAVNVHHTLGQYAYGPLVYYKRKGSSLRLFILNGGSERNASVPELERKTSISGSYNTANATRARGPARTIAERKQRYSNGKRDPLGSANRRRCRHVNTARDASPTFANQTAPSPAVAKDAGSTLAQSPNIA